MIGLIVSQKISTLMYSLFWYSSNSLLLRLTSTVINVKSQQPMYQFEYFVKSFRHNHTIVNYQLPLRGCNAMKDSILMNFQRHFTLYKNVSLLLTTH